MGQKLLKLDHLEGESELKFVELNRGTYDIEVQLTNIRSNKNLFKNNPSGFALKITKDITIVSSESPAWKTNPVGVSAVIIPPPCRKKVRGVGIVTDIIVTDPGNGYPPPGDNISTADIPRVTLQLIDIDLITTGIGYTSGDRIIVDTPGGGPIPFTPVLNDFGQITGVDVPGTPEIPTDGGSSTSIVPPGDGSLTIDPVDPGVPELGFGGLGGGTTPPTEILQVTDLPGEIGVGDDTGVLIPLIPSGGDSTGGPAYEAITDNIGLYPPTHLGTAWIPTPGIHPVWDSNTSYKIGDKVIVSGKVPAPGPFYGFTEYPNIYPISNTGLGFRGRPVFKVVIVPDDILPDESVLQVVDIPGLRKTGYVNGKPYYGQVFAKDGNLYAGISQTIGQLVPVYATLQESILNRQTIQPSAILRSGSETNSNNPNLNIPNTPDNLI